MSDLCVSCSLAHGDVAKAEEHACDDVLTCACPTLMWLVPGIEGWVG